MRRKSGAFLITVILLLSLIIPQAYVFAADNQNITVLFSNGGTQANSNTIYARFKVINDRASALNLGDLKLRYYYQKDADKPQNFWCDHAGMMNGYRYMDVTSKVKGTFIEMQGVMTDNCLEISFANDAGSIPAGGSIEVHTRIARNDWTNYDQSNDYSYMPAGFYTANNKIAAFVGADQVYGMQPPSYTDPIEVNPLALDVVSVNIPNARQIIVNYNGVVSGSAVETADNYYINGKAAAYASLSADGKSVTLTTTTVNSMSNFSINNMLVINKNVGFSSDKTFENLAFIDTAAPTMVSAVVAEPRTIKLTFSEPIQPALTDTIDKIVAAFTLDDGKIGLNPMCASFNVTDTVLTLSTLSVINEGEHSIRISGTTFKDGVGYPVARCEKSFSYIKDTALLTAAITSATENTVKIKFSKVIKAGTFAGNTNVKLIQTYNTTLNQITGAAVSTTDNQEFTVTFVKPLPPGTSTVWLYYADGTLDVNKIQDVCGNIFAAASFQVNVTEDDKDKVAPDLDGTAPFVQISATKVRVNFTEAIDIATLADKNNYTVSGSALGTNDTVTAINNNKSAVITFAAAPATGSSIVVGRVKDVAGNWSAWLSKTVGTIKSSFDTISQSAAEIIGANRIKLTVNDEITDCGSPADYVYSTDGSTWYNVSDIFAVMIDSSHKKTYIELNIGYDAGGDTGLKTPIYIATISGGMVGNASPNVRNVFGQTLKVVPTICSDKLAPKFLSAATGIVSSNRLKTIVLTLSELIYIPTVSDSDFVVEGFEVDTVNVDNNADGKAYVTLTLKDKDNSFAEKPKVTLVGTIEDMYRNKLTGPVENTCQ